MAIKTITLSNEAAIAIEASWEIRQASILPHLNKFNNRLLEVLSRYGLTSLPEKYNLALFKNDGTPNRPLVFEYEVPDPVNAPASPIVVPTNPNG